MSRRWLPMVALALSCSGGDGRMGTTPDAGGATSARVRVSITAPRAGDPTLAVEARMLRYRDLDAESAEILAGATVPALDSLPEGRCVLVSHERRLDEALALTSPDSAVQMLDAGEVVVRAAGVTRRLLPRYLPEIMPFVYGVLYERDDLGGAFGDGPAELGGGPAFLSAFGGEDIGRFDVAFEVPAAPRLVSVAPGGPGRAARGGDAAHAGAELVEPVLVDRAADLTVRWAAPRASAEEGLVVVLAWNEGSGGALRCRTTPNGASGTVVIGRAALGLVPDGAELEVSVERSVRAPFAAAGLDSGEIEVTVRDVVAGRSL